MDLYSVSIELFYASTFHGSILFRGYVKTGRFMDRTNQATVPIPVYQDPLQKIGLKMDGFIALQ